MRISVRISLLPDRAVVWRHVGRVVRIGRDRQCEIRFPGARHVGVSRQHARIDFRPEGAYLVDTASKNGTFHNGERVTAAVPLQAGDQIRLGRTGPQLTVEAIVRQDDTPGGRSIAAAIQPPVRRGLPSINEINRRFEDDLASIVARIAANHAVGDRPR